MKKFETVWKEKLTSLFPIEAIVSIVAIPNNRSKKRSLFITLGDIYFGYYYSGIPSKMNTLSCTNSKLNIATYQFVISNFSYSLPNYIAWPKSSYNDIWVLEERNIQTGESFFTVKINKPITI